ncbi:unnamed protein product [Effrenium voratum]|nr:unnamed protein product [Effrenium voratum]
MMRQARPGLMEYQLESTFAYSCHYNGGCRLLSYTPIAGSGPNSAALCSVRAHGCRSGCVAVCVCSKLWLSRFCTMASASLFSPFWLPHPLWQR